MQKVVCIYTGRFLNVGNIYYINLESICSDSDGDWYTNVYEDDKQNVWIGRYRLEHFKSVI
jgi:CRISPR/Cas system endoribonuclease Cas6 (RAMP superfamily)